MEITNVCNLSCAFCAPSRRPPLFMPVETFKNIAGQIRSFAGIVSLHVLGEPFMHPQLPEIIRVCSDEGLNLNLVTNGTLLDKFGSGIFSEKSLRQLSLSLHSLGSLDRGTRMEKLARLVEFAKKKPENVIFSMRLRGDWNNDFERETAAYILNAFNAAGNPPKTRGSIKLGGGIYLNSGPIFQWPGLGRYERKKGCLGLRHHFAVLSNGDVVPCCIDYDGHMKLGNVAEKPLAEILDSGSARQLKDSIAGETPMPAYCATCGFHSPQ